MTSMTMELGEVANAQFAVPVVGVVLCALLVYAFGFKSPVQPPSFDFVNEFDRKKKRKNRKLVTNGNAVVETLVKPNAPVTPKQTAKPASNLQQTPTTKKAKKIQTVKKNPVQVPVQEDIKIENEDFGSGEWTVATARKDKKSRGKVEPLSNISKEEAKEKEILEKDDDTTGPAKVDVATVTPPKSSPKKKKKKGIKAIDDSESQGEKELPGQSTTNQIEKNTASNVNQKNAIVDSADGLASKSIKKVNDDTKKSKQIEPSPSSTQSQAARSPKKKSGKNDTNQNTEVSTPVSTEKSPASSIFIEDASVSCVSKIDTKKTDSLDVVNSKEETSPKLSAPVVFDEMGGSADWKEAKPIKKKKKVRRDN